MTKPNSTATAAMMRVLLGAGICSFAALSACNDKDTSTQKTTTTRQTDTPDGTKTTTETTERKVETEHKNPPK